MTKNEEIIENLKKTLQEKLSGCTGVEITVSDKMERIIKNDKRN